MGISENAEIAYTFANASFHDKSRDVHMNLGGSGRALLKCEVPSGDGEEYVKKFLGTATEKAVSSMAMSCAGYEQLVLHVNELADMVRKVMSDENAVYGLMRTVSKKSRKAVQKNRSLHRTSRKLMWLHRRLISRGTALTRQASDRSSAMRVVRTCQTGQEI